MKKEILISVGIPAYNEGANIKNLLLSILAQRQEGFKLQEIIVVSDGSIDRTVQEAKSVNDKRIRVIDEESRRGPAYRQNKIRNQVDSDYLIFLNADILIKSNTFLREMVKAYQSKKNIGIVSPRITPLPARGHIGKTLMWHIYWKRQLYEQINNKDNIYLCNGIARGFSKKAYKAMSWPHSWAEDAFSFLAIKRNGLNFKYCRSAVAYYQPPQNIKDHASQSVRFMFSSRVLGSFFSKEELRAAYAIPKKLLVTSIIKGLLSSPLKAITYLVIYAYCKIVAVSTGSTSEYDLWEISTSTKTLNTGSKGPS